MQANTWIKTCAFFFSWGYKSYALEGIKGHLTTFLGLMTCGLMGHSQGLFDKYDFKFLSSNLKLF